MKAFFKALGVVLLIIFLIIIFIIIGIIDIFSSLSGRAKVENQKIEVFDDVIIVTVPLVKDEEVISLPQVWLCNKEAGYKPNYNLSSWCSGLEHKNYDYSNCHTNITPKDTLPDIITIYRKKGEECIKQDVNTREYLKYVYEVEFSLNSKNLGIAEEVTQENEVLNINRLDKSKYSLNSTLRINDDYKVTLKYFVEPSKAYELKSDELEVNGKRIVLNFK